MPGAGWMLPRGQGKTSLTAILALYELLAGAEGAQVVVVATDERQAGLCHRVASRMVELHPALEDRVYLYADRLEVPARGSVFQVLPAVPKRLEGLDFTLAIVDEAGRVDQEVYEVVALATGKQRSSVVLAIGTPGPELENTVLGRLRTYALDHPEDQLVVWREHSATGFEDHPVDCLHCWELANPALGDFLARDGLEACLPPKMREASFRRARLCQLTDQRKHGCRPLPGPPVPMRCHPWVTGPRSSSPSRAHSMAIPPSWSWPRSPSGPISTWSNCGRPPATRCPSWTSRPPSGVPALAGPGDRRRSLPLGTIAPAPRRRRTAILEYPQSPGRMTPATSRFYEAVVNGALTHSGDSRQARHIGNAVLREDARGARLAKERKDSPRRIDAAVMAHDRAAALAGTVRDSIYI
jgi:hypothetical protein